MNKGGRGRTFVGRRSVQRIPVRLHIPTDEPALDGVVTPVEDEAHDDQDSDHDKDQEDDGTYGQTCGQQRYWIRAKAKREEQTYRRPRRRK